jgi:hypothetical protein
MIIRLVAGVSALTDSFFACRRQAFKLPVQYGWGILRYEFRNSRSRQRAERSRLKQREFGHSAEVRNGVHGWRCV